MLLQQPRPQGHYIRRSSPRAVAHLAGWMCCGNEGHILGQSRVSGLQWHLAMDLCGRDGHIYVDATACVGVGLALVPLGPHGPQH